jgi:hypothetical protein
MDSNRSVFDGADIRSIVPQCAKNYAPEIGSLFTSRLNPREKGKIDYTLHDFRDHTGYVKNGTHIKEEEMVEGNFYRFIVVAVHSKDHHNYFYAIPFRKVSANESKRANILPAMDFVKIKDLADIILGIENKERSRRNELYRMYIKNKI